MSANFSTRNTDSSYGKFQFEPMNEGSSKFGNAITPTIVSHALCVKSAQGVLDTFQTSSSNDKDILNKLKEDIDNCKRENYDSDEEYNTELQRRITIYSETKGKIDQNNNNNSSERMALFERFMSSVGGFLKDVGVAVEHGGEAVLNFLANCFGA